MLFPSAHPFQLWPMSWNKRSGQSNRPPYPQEARKPNGKYQSSPSNNTLAHKIKGWCMAHPVPPRPAQLQIRTPLKRRNLRTGVELWPNTQTAVVPEKKRRHRRKKQGQSLWPQKKSPLPLICSCCFPSALSPPMEPHIISLNIATNSPVSSRGEW